MQKKMEKLSRLEALASQRNLRVDRKGKERLRQAVERELGWNLRQ